MGDDTQKNEYEEAPAGGTGLCPEAQADGVPCTELGRDCEVCERAFPKKAKESNSAGLS
jgi:hypothetical protein